MDKMPGSYMGGSGGDREPRDTNFRSPAFLPVLGFEPVRKREPPLEIRRFYRTALRVRESTPQAFRHSRAQPVHLLVHAKTGLLADALKLPPQQPRVHPPLH